MKVLSLLLISSLTFSANASETTKSKNIEIFNDKMKVISFRILSSSNPDGPIRFPEDKALALTPALKTKITSRS